MKFTFNHDCDSEKSLYEEMGVSEQRIDEMMEFVSKEHSRLKNQEGGCSADLLRSTIEFAQNIEEVVLFALLYGDLRAKQELMEQVETRSIKINPDNPAKEEQVNKLLEHLEMLSEDMNPTDEKLKNTQSDKSN